MTEKRSSISWGQHSSAKNVDRNRILMAWLFTLISFLRASFIGAIAFYVSLGYGIVLIRSKGKANKINGWIITLLFAFRFILLILVGYRII